MTLAETPFFAKLHSFSTILSVLIISNIVTAFDNTRFDNVCIALDLLSDEVAHDYHFS